ncbi:MAG: transporter substrate-binding protein [Rhizobacter sp.]|nr:transporter substrate-binding protein [Rhizobacter sp.]
MYRFSRRRAAAAAALTFCAATMPAFAQTAAKPPVKIAIALFGPHPTLQQVVDGFKKQLASEGVNAVYDEGNVNFDRSLAPALLTREAAADPALMLTITTPMTQTARQVLATRTFPIVFAPVTDPVAAKLVPSWEHGDKLMAGVSNIPDLDATCDFVKALIPGAKRLGILYNPGDDSDVAFVSRLDKVVGAHGLELVKVGVDNVNDIAPRVQSLQGRADALFVPASSLLQPAGSAIASVTNRIKMPVFNSNVTQVTNHQFLASMSVDWSRIGANAGHMAAEILGGKKTTELAVSLPSKADHEMKISGQRMADLGLKLPASLKDCGCVVE